jgi:hypothetical protein
MKLDGIAVGALVVLMGSSASVEAQTQTITVGQLDCLPLKGNGVLNATVSPETPGTTTRLYFRRLNDTVEDFYYVDMASAGGGGYWATFPIPTGATAKKVELKNHQYEGKNVPKNNRPWAEWWRAKEGSNGRNPNGDLDDKEIRERASVGKSTQRTWMTSMDDAALQAWLDRQKYEPAEYFVATVDGAGRVVASSGVRAVEVSDSCRTSLTPQQQGYGKNLVVGETSTWQASEEVFHWECDGVVTRKNSNNVLRADDRCRACVVAWWPAAVPAGVIAIVGITEDDPIDVSPSRP